MDKGTEDLLISKNFSFFNLHLIPLHQAGADTIPFSFKKTTDKSNQTKPLQHLRWAVGSAIGLCGEVSESRTSHLLILCFFKNHVETPLQLIFKGMTANWTQFSIMGKNQVSGSGASQSFPGTPGSYFRSQRGYTTDPHSFCLLLQSISSVSSCLILFLYPLQVKRRGGRVSVSSLFLFDGTLIKIPGSN